MNPIDYLISVSSPSVVNPHNLFNNYQESCKCALSGCLLYEHCMFVCGFHCRSSVPLWMAPL